MRQSGYIWSWRRSAGWNLPLPDQLQQYADRLNEHDERDVRIAVISECAQVYPPVQALPSSIDGIPVAHIPWARIAELVASTTTASRIHAEKRLLLELHRYLKGLMTMQNVTSNLVYVVVLGQDPLRWSSLTFKDTVIERDFYYHPVGGPKGWPHTPPNYIGFRFDGHLQQIRHVDHYDVITRPHEYIPEIIPEANWSDEPHFLYTLGPPIEAPNPPQRQNLAERAALVRPGPTAYERDNQGGARQDAAASCEGRRDSQLEPASLRLVAASAQELQVLDG